MNIDHLLETEPSEQLLHYTNADGLLGILNSKEIWATDATYLNDYQELLYARNIIADHLQVLCDYPEWEPSFQITSDEKDLMRRYVTLFRSFRSIPEVFVASFSCAYDSLSQWREYGGYSVAVSGAALRNCAQRAQGLFVRCVYQQSRQVDLVKLIVKKMILEYRKHGDPQFLKEYMVENLLCKLSPLLKHPSFEEEDEWRIVIPKAPPLDRIEFRRRGQRVVPYVKIDVAEALKTRVDSPVMPQVRLGPGSDGVTDITVRRLTKKTLGFEAYVSRSGTPYRPTPL